MSRSRAHVTFLSKKKCTVATGSWFSYFDRGHRTKAAGVTVVNTVPAAEAWQSGVRTWTPTRRRAFVNDLLDAREFAIVTDKSARARGDKDPAEWLPTTKSRCQYVAEWTVVKIRWNLSVNSAEKAMLDSLAKGCSNRSLVIRRK